MRIAHMDERAAALGLRIGQGLADAKAIHPGLDILPADANADRRILEGIADWCDQYTPLVALDAPDGLFLDITGCAHLFGGEHMLLQTLLSLLARQGFSARGAIAKTAGAAWAAARFADAQAVHVEQGCEVKALRPFRLAALRIDAETVGELEKVGLKTIGHLIDRPRAPLVRRFGRMPVMRLDQALGHIDEALSPRLPVPDFSTEQRLAEPVGRVDDIEQLLFSLSRNLKPSLETKCIGARVLELTLFRVDGAVSRLCVGASRPVRDPETIVKLFRERIKNLGEDFDAGYGFDILRLNVLAHAPLVDEQGDMAGHDHDDGHDMMVLFDRIAARLGHHENNSNNALKSHPVMQLENRQSHVPENAEHWVSLKSSRHKQADRTDKHRPVAPRPVKILTPAESIEVIAQVPEGPPVQFKWRRAQYRIQKSEGPERLAGEWWGDNAPENLQPLPCDYYRVEDMDGRRYWIYRRDLYGERGSGNEPRWFMHGLFA